MKLLVDNNLPPRLARALDTLFEPDHRVAALRDKFGRSDLKDEEWIPVLGREGEWAVLSADLAIAKKKPSRDLFLKSGLVGFFLAPAVQRLALPLQTARILRMWAAMVQLAATTANGVFELGQTGDKFRTISR